MVSGGRKWSGAGVVLATALAALAASAQEAGDEFEPAVDTSAVFDQPAAPESAADTPAVVNEPPAAAPAAACCGCICWGGICC